MKTNTPEIRVRHGFVMVQFSIALSDNVPSRSPAGHVQKNNQRHKKPIDHQLFLSSGHASLCEGSIEPSYHSAVRVVVGDCGFGPIQNCAGSAASKLVIHFTRHGICIVVEYHAAVAVIEPHFSAVISAVSRVCDELLSGRSANSSAIRVTHCQTPVCDVT